MNQQFLLLCFALACLGELAKANPCFMFNKTWDYGDSVHGELHVESPALCFGLCSSNKSCVAFTWYDAESHPLPNTCLLFDELHNETACSNCTSGTMKSCLQCSTATECALADDLLTMLNTKTESACLESCNDTALCNFYTYYGETTLFPHLCLLYSGCETSVECKGCLSGPPDCSVEEFCPDIKYFHQLTEADRNYKYTNATGHTGDSPGSAFTSPDWRGPGWYRFNGDAGTQLPETPPGLNHCGTAYPGWLKGEHPYPPGIQQDMLACFQITATDTCNPTYSRNITVNNCGPYFLYFLDNSSSSNFRYCSV